LHAAGAGYFDMRPRGILADVAPTVLHLLGVPQPAEMTGQSLVMARTEGAKTSR
jgi:2,3-bisphosphoglycerate-independent phosphoglycerate mutase